MKKVDCFDILGQFGKIGTDPGMYSITDDLKRQGYNVHNSPYADNALQTIVDDAMKSSIDDLLVVIGASLGGNNGPEVATALKGHRIVDLMIGYQPSTYGMHVPVPNNVKLAICIWNPVWIITLGLGNYEWVPADDNPCSIEISKDNGSSWQTFRHGPNGNMLRIIENYDLHPGDANMTVRNYTYNVIRHLRSN
jgi:hypothetical protein